ncbi:MAG TPA: precorrin-6y C5,15-methyltransferase (decarboxylating) subunit CbiE, partial [Planctomycetia bacterium]|nr:precorrin-6y C5,15-methyltransferase (decarboxylating) subunit CbiE [Planctomycetia bacterium]
PDAGREKVLIVGIGDDGLPSLTERAQAAVRGAAVLVGTPRVLAMAPGGSAERIAIEADFAASLDRVTAAAADRRTVVLVGGDPLFYGIARLLVERLGKDRVEIEPHVSSMQLAFARVKEDWDEAYLGDVSRIGLEQALDRIQTAERCGLFTTEVCPPQQVAAGMQKIGLDYFRVYVCENLGTRNEVVTQGSPAEISTMEFGPLAVMVLVRESGVPDRQRLVTAHRRFGNPDDYFRQSRPKRGLLTPAEVRVIALAELGIDDGSVVWDVGAGSGSVSVEAARLARNGKVFAIEPDPEDASLVRENAKTFGVANVELVVGRAPQCFGKLPPPDAVFLGGLGRDTAGILADAFAALKPGGRLAVNVASLENVQRAWSWLHPAAAHVNVLMVNLARGTPQLDSLRFQSVNPSFLISAVKAG